MGIIVITIILDKSDSQQINKPGLKDEQDEQD
jgi:hypothetical protein